MAIRAPDGANKNVFHLQFKTFSVTIELHHSVLFLFDFLPRLPSLFRISVKEEVKEKIVF